MRKKILILGILLITTIIMNKQVCLAISVEEARSIVVNHYVQYLKENQKSEFSKVFKNFKQNLKSYQKDTNYEINKFLIKNGIKDTEDYYIKADDLMYYKIQLKKIPVAFDYNPDGNLISYSYGYLVEDINERDNSTYIFYTYIYPQDELFGLTLLINDEEYAFILDNGELIYYSKIK